MRSLLRLSIIALALTTAACVQHTDQDNNGWDVGDDTGSDTRTDTESDTGQDTTTDTGQDTTTDTGQDTTSDAGSDAGDTGQTHSIEFELVNNSGRPLYASPTAFGLNTCFGQPWLRVQHEGDGIGLEDDPCLANCGSEDDPIACDLDCAIPTREQYRFGDGEVRSYTWDANAWKTRDTCEISESMAGETLTAEFCYGGEFTHNSAQLLAETCQTVEFAVDQPSQTVRVEIEPLQPREVTFQMVNETGNDVYALPGGASAGRTCYGAWNSIGDGQRTFTPRSPCSGHCTCDMVEQNPGEQCNIACPAAPCPAPTTNTVRLVDGDKRTDVWDGLITIQDEVADQTCERRVVPLKRELTATFCYAETVVGQDGFSHLGPQTCRDFTFDRTTTDMIEWKLQ